MLLRCAFSTLFMSELGAATFKLLYLSTCFLLFPREIILLLNHTKFINVCVCISLFEQSLHCDLGIFEHKKSHKIFIHLTFFSHKFMTSPLTKSSIIISSSFSTNFADIRQAKSMGGIWLHCVGVKIYGDYLTVLQCFSPIFFVRQGLCGAVVINFVQKAP